MKHIGVDVGGTFTDFVLVDTARGDMAIHKVPTTPDDPSEGVIRGIVELCKRSGVDRASIDHVLHGTTTATNAILEYDGAATGMITNEGYRDVLHIGRHQRPQHYSIMQEVPWQDRPLVQRRYRKTVRGRIAPPRGEELIPLDDSGVRRAAQELKEAGVKAISICFLFSYLNPAHEDRARAIVLEEFPECFVTTSSSVSPQFREFERFTTTAMNAFIGPKVRGYVAHIEAGLAAQGFKADLHIMCSNGGVATAKMIVDRPVLTLLSGPAAGILGGAWAGRLSARKNMITFDVGGTSADVGIVRQGEFVEATARDTTIGGYPLLVPMLDVHTIGAGGGSIAYVDDGGAFRVGPRSAGARPGPAAYGQGGTAPTVTDANVVLGRLISDHFLGGEMRLDLAAAENVIRQLGRQLGLSAPEAAFGVLTVVNANMANLIRSRTVQKGLDPREFALVAFGGGGPLQAVDVASELSIPEVIIPPAPGITSAMGLITTDLKYDAIKTEFQIGSEIDPATLERDFQVMERQLARQFEADGLAREQYRFERAGDLRYVGQGYELRVAFPSAAFDESALGRVLSAFHDRHRDEYGHTFPDSPIEVVNIRVTGIGSMPKLQHPSVTQEGTVRADPLGEKRCIFKIGQNLETVPTTLYRREALPAGTEIRGPAIIVQKDTTTIIRPQDRLRADHGGNLIISVGREG